MSTRLLLAVALLLVLLFAARTVLAAEPTEEVVQVAELAGVDPWLLQGAVNTTQAPPREYLHHSGELPRPAASIGWTVWDRLATECEARGWANPWVAVSPGGRYRGGIQTDAAFWARYGGLAFAPTADRASREQQILVAQRGQAVQGWAAWPVCSRRLGLR
jgi:hypothetical protein